MINKKSEKANLENKKGVFFLIGLVIALGSILLAFEWKTQVHVPMEWENRTIVPDDFVYIPPTQPEKKELPPKQIEAPTFELVDDETEIVDEFNAYDSDATIDNIFDFDAFVFKPTKNKNDVEEEILNFAEVMPEFPGGNIALIKYLGSNVNYPIIAQENGIQGKVYIGFVVDENGNINDVILLRGVDKSLDNEALRVVRSMPKWKPGKQGGKAVKVRFNVPILFDLQ